MRRSTRQWVRKAESDFRLAVRIGRGREPFHDELCFHCQQSAEKYLKALLEELGLAIPKTHNLDDLFGLLFFRHIMAHCARFGADSFSSLTSPWRLATPATTRPNAKQPLHSAGLARSASPAADCLAYALSVLA